MRYLPRKNFVDEMFDSMFDFPVSQTSGLLKTDLYEKDGRYYLDIDVPGVNKEDIEISLFQGNLTVSATKQSQNKEADENRSYIKQERFYGKASRTFYVGEGITEQDIVASIDNGILNINFPTIKQKEITETKKISIL